MLEPQPDKILNLSSVEVLKAYLGSFISLNVTNTTDTDTNIGLSAGAIAGIVVSVIVIIIILAVISAVSFYFYKHSKYKVMYDFCVVIRI